MDIIQESTEEAVISVAKTLGHATARELWQQPYQSFWRDVVRAYQLQQRLKDESKSNHKHHHNGR
jgi:hypothetical protein